MMYLCDLNQIDDDLRKANGDRDQGCIEIYDLEKFLHGPEQEIIVVHAHGCICPLVGPGGFR
jgi:hypothetical protein